MRDIVASCLNASHEQIAKTLNDGLPIEVQNGNENKKDNDQSAHEGTAGNGA
jgi:hypothetical protein